MKLGSLKAAFNAQDNAACPHEGISTMRGMGLGVLGALLSAALLSGCASNDGDVAAIEQARTIAQRTDVLPAQTLPVGHCGLLLFGRVEPYPFIVFENETLRRAQVLYDQQVYELGVSPQQGSFAPGERFRRVYLHGDTHRVFTLTGAVGDETGSGPRLEEVLLRVRELDGTETVRPLGGVYSCRTRTSTPTPSGG